MAAQADWVEARRAYAWWLMRDTALWLLIPTFPPLVLWIVLIVVLIAAQTPLVSTVLGWRSEQRLRCSAPCGLRRS
jgi:hypothetical protein